MLCEKCSASLDYGAKYCRICGEKVSSDILSEEYNHTFWGKIQIAEDWYSKLSLQKFTGHVIVKIVVLVAILAYGMFQLWQNGRELKILASDSYSVAYNSSADEYYIKTSMSEVDLNMYIPPLTDEVRIIGYDSDGNVMEEKSLSSGDYKKEDAFRMTKSEFSYTTVRIVKNDKLTEPMKFYIVD